jgi:hypothetical protein
MFASRFVSRARSIATHLPTSSTSSSSSSIAPAFTRTLASVSPNLPKSPQQAQPKVEVEKKNGISPSERLENSRGERAGESLKEEGGGTTELFGFEVTKKESSVGGKEKTDGRPIYLDAQVSVVVVDLGVLAVVAVLRD